MVDDEPGLRLLLDTILTGWGYRVLTAASAEEALELATVEPVDLLLTDLHLPRMNGLQLAEHFARICPQSKQLFMTAPSLEEEDLAGKTVLSKPFDWKSLRDALCSELGAYQSARILRVADDPLRLNRQGYRLRFQHYFHGTRTMSLNHL